MKLLAYRQVSWQFAWAQNSSYAFTGFIWYISANIYILNRHQEYSLLPQSDLQTKKMPAHFLDFLGKLNIHYRMKGKIYIQKNSANNVSISRIQQNKNLPHCKYNKQITCLWQWGKFVQWQQNNKDENNTGPFLSQKFNHWSRMNIKTNRYDSSSWVWWLLNWHYNSLKKQLCENGMQLQVQCSLGKNAIKQISYKFH